VSTTAKTEPAATPGAPEAQEESDRCLACGAALAEDQEWCLECGAARTVIHAPPDWRVGLAIILAVVMVVAIVLVLLLP
jgi:RNA polymerase subunit RPABC4/transcription elongation factor Spt4